MKKNKQNKKGKYVPVSLPLAKQATGADSWKPMAALVFILVLSAFLYLPALNNAFVWDDEIYIVKNNLITHLSWTSIKAIFTDTGSDNYAPVTTLINALYYKIGGLNSFVFHAGNLTFHLVNIALLFWFIRLLSDRWEIAAITSLLFGVHPVNAESVAWASADSTLFNNTFYFVALIAWVCYLRNYRVKYFLLTFFFFALAVLSKATAVMLPVILLLIDYVKGRKINGRALIEKIPFVAISVVISVITLNLKYQDFAPGDVASYTIPQRLVFACYAFFAYIVKLFMPYHLTAFYPYPQIESGIPFIYYACVVLFLVLTGAVLYSLRHSKTIFFGIVFFAVTMLPKLQLFPIGAAVMADRYCYRPSVGIFFLVAEGLFLLRHKKFAVPAFSLAAMLAIFFSVTTRRQCDVWDNSLTLWNNVIKRQPTVAMAYYNRGSHLMKKEITSEEALADFSKAIELKPDYTEAYNNRGVILMNDKKYTEALKDYTIAVELNKKRAVKRLYQSLDTEKLNENCAQTYNFRGVEYLKAKKYTMASEDFAKAIEIKPDFMGAYYNKGVALQQQKDYSEAIDCYTKVIELEPDYSNAYYNRAVAHYDSGEKGECCNDLSSAAALGNEQAEQAIKQICK